MSSTGVSLRALQVNQRVSKRSIENTLRESAKFLKDKTKSDFPRLDPNLAKIRAGLKELNDLCIEMAEHIDHNKKSDADLQTEENKIFADYDQLYTAYRDYKGRYLSWQQDVNQRKAKAE